MQRLIKEFEALQEQKTFLFLSETGREGGGSMLMCCSDAPFLRYQWASV